MATIKVTFTLDQATAEFCRTRRTGFSGPKATSLRESIMEFHDRLGRLSGRERLAMLRTFDEVVPKIPERSAAAVDRELREIRQARKAGGTPDAFSGSAMILLDTSVLIDSLSGQTRSAGALRSAIEQGERILLPSLVLLEWLRGPRGLRVSEAGISRTSASGKDANIAWCGLLVPW